MPTLTPEPSTNASRTPYPVATMLRARELREAGWYATAIRRILTDEGHGSPSLFTIQTWTNRRYLERHHDRMRTRGAARTAERARFRLQGSTPAYRLEFMRALRAADLSPNAIGKVCGVVFGERLSQDQVRYALEKGEDGPEAERQRLALVAML